MSTDANAPDGRPTMGHIRGLGGIRAGSDTSEYRYQEAIEITRSAEDIDVLIADVSRMGQWSPVCRGGTYDEDGEWFTGTNAMGETRWETRCRVVVADSGHEFAFINQGLEGRVEMVLWSFRFEPVEGGGTKVTQTWEVLPDYADGLGLDEASAVGVLDMMKTAALEGMPKTLLPSKPTQKERPDECFQPTVN
jgi:Polyketide cyclase / dehydrase and lipid transport